MIDRRIVNRRSNKASSGKNDGSIGRSIAKQRDCTDFKQLGRFVGPHVTHVAVSPGTAETYVHHVFTSLRT